MNRVSLTLVHNEFSDTNSISTHHEENQDSILADDPVFSVADGVGGYAGGKVASSLCIELLQRNMKSVKDEKELKGSVLNIHSKLLTKALELDYPMMGTTVAVCKVFEDERKIISANVGDSPIFQIRELDVNSMYIEDSERNKDPWNMSTLTQYLGMPLEEPVVHTTSTNYSRGDIVLLCTDGVSDNILGGDRDHKAIAKLVHTKKSAKEIVREAMKKGVKRDDMSAILLFL